MRRDFNTVLSDAGGSTYQNLYTAPEQVRRPHGGRLKDGLALGLDLAGTTGGGSLGTVLHRCLVSDKAAGTHPKRPPDPRPGFIVDNRFYREWDFGVDCQIAESLTRGRRVNSRT